MSMRELTSLDVIERAGQRTLPERAARAGAKRTARDFGRATASRRPLPDFLLIGAKRGGTTSFMDSLREHPGNLELFPRAEKIKGLYFFDEQFDRGDRWYRSHFPSTSTRVGRERRLGHRVVAGEGSPYYLFHPLAPARAQAMVPNAQILVVLRNPIERAFSHWKERRRNQTETLDFDAALAAESDRLAGETARIEHTPGYRSFAHRHCSYAAQGDYAPMLERWFSAFGRDRVWVAPSEEVFADPQAAVDEVHERLGLPGHRLADYRRLNAEPSRDLDPGLRRELAAQLEPAIQSTALLLGRALPWS